MRIAILAKDDQQLAAATGVRVATADYLSAKETNGSGVERKPDQMLTR